MGRMTRWGKRRIGDGRSGTKRRNRCGARNAVPGKGLLNQI